MSLSHTKSCVNTVTNPMGASSGSNRFYRGGSWNFDAAIVRAAYRRRGVPGYRASDLGFRLARSAR